MAHQKVHLESIFHYICQHPKSNLTTISQDFKLSIKQIRRMLFTLKSMDLPINIGVKNVQLTQAIIPLNVQYLQTKIKNKIFYFFSTQSTNRHAKQSAQNAIYVTEHQSQGRGQHGKSWVTPLGQSIALTLSHSFSIPLANLSGLNIAIGVAVIKAMSQYTKQAISVKWPNDIIGENGKIAGILIEAQGNKHTSTACIGIGINWSLGNSLLKSIDQPCMNLETSGINRNDFIETLIKEIYAILKEFSTHKILNILKQWHTFDLLKGKSIKVITDKESFEAEYQHVNSEGLLVVSVNKKFKNISSASIKLTSGN